MDKYIKKMDKSKKITMQNTKVNKLYLVLYELEIWGKTCQKNYIKYEDSRERINVKVIMKVIKSRELNLQKLHMINDDSIFLFLTFDDNVHFDQTCARISRIVSVTQRKK